MDTEQEILERIESEYNFSERELRKLLDYEISRESFEDRRWTRGVSSILSICGRFFELDWEQGLTEMQPNEYYNNPYEVVLKQTKKTVIIKEWEKK